MTKNKSVTYQITMLFIGREKIRFSSSFIIFANAKRPYLQTISKKMFSLNSDKLHFIQFKVIFLSKC
ncbi:hypothetical protein J3D55_002605 [Chryseobacterium ginsenosidimutans]|nr:hypothetical protein [Chryseobacterium ginsenosidimutans]